MCAENFTVRFRNDEFDESFGFTDGQRFPVCREWKLAHLKLQSLFFRGSFRQTDAGDLRLAIGASREDANALRLVLSKHALDRLNRFPARHVSQPGWSDHISCRVDSTHVCGVTIVH